MKNCLLLLMLFFLVSCAWAEKHQYKLLTERLTLDYVDHKYIDVSVGTFRRNQTNAINITVTLKCDLPDNTIVSLNAWKRLGNDYRIPTMKLKKTLKDALEMESFDLQSFFVRHAKPPVVWPMKKDVIYRLEGWIPDSTKFPPNLPDGQWKVQVTIEFANNAKIAVEIAYLTLEYYK